VKLQVAVGNANFVDSHKDRISYSYGTTPHLSQLASSILRPTAALQMSELSVLANEEGFEIVSRGSCLDLREGIPVENSVAMFLNHWNQILKFDERYVTAWIEPGVITEVFQSEDEMARLGYRLAVGCIDPND